MYETSPRAERVEGEILTVVRRGVQDPLVFTVKRNTLPIHSMDAAYLIEPKVGYIRINRFGATTFEEFKGAMKSLQKQGMRDLILDLQGNGGGYLNAAIDLANEFLGQKELIVYTEGRATKRSNFYAKGNGAFRMDGWWCWSMNIRLLPVRLSAVPCRIGTEGLL